MKDACAGPWKKAVIVDVWFTPQKARTKRAVADWLASHKQPKPRKVKKARSGALVAQVRDPKRFKCFRYGKWLGPDNKQVRFLFGGNPKKGLGTPCLGGGC